MNKLWQEKVEKAVVISKRYGFEEQNKEFWQQQPAGVISLLIEIVEREYGTVS